MTQMTAPDALSVFLPPPAAHTFSFVTASSIAVTGEQSCPETYSFSEAYMLPAGRIPDYDAVDDEAEDDWDEADEVDDDEDEDDWDDEDDEDEDYDDEDDEDWDEDDEDEDYDDEDDEDWDEDDEE